MRSYDGDLAIDGYPLLSQVCRKRNDDEESWRDMMKSVEKRLSEEIEQVKITYSGQ
jgi:hypothetical protein